MGQRAHPTPASGEAHDALPHLENETGPVEESGNDGVWDGLYEGIYVQKGNAG